MGVRGVVALSLVALLAWSCLSSSPFAKASETTGDLAEGIDLPKVEEPIGSVPAGSTTDIHTSEREKESINRSGEKFTFQAEVSRLMDIIINSLYSNKDIFLRELISNASDALDKIRFLALTDNSVLGEGEQSKLEIQIKLDPEKKILTIRDRGIGMSREDLIKNLGTIAKSGTSSFLEQMQKGGDLNLIGQFGVGFYSVYLVADFVEVHSKSNDDKQWVWASKADGNFEVYEDTDSEPLGRGTEIRIHLKEEASEYSSEFKLKELVKKYSEFINFPISLWSSNEVDEPVEETEEAGEEKEADADTEDKDTDTEGEEDEEESKDEEKPKTKKVTKWDWELLNDVKAIWLRSPKDITEEEYFKFYQSISKDITPEKPTNWTHFSAEGDVEFKAILYIPPKAASDYYDNYYSSKGNLKLYVRRVFISDDFEDLLPKYLNFLKGLVDSDTLPLNVSREMLQQHGSLKTIKKKLVRKALDMIKRIAEEEEEAKKKTVEDKAEDEDEKDENAVDPKTKYTNFWKEFGKSLKLGVIEDNSNRNRLAKLLRFQSSKSGEDFVSLDEYLERMKEGQKQIYYLTGQSKEQLEKSPFLEKLLKKGYEVLYLTDPVDEYLMQNLTEFEDKKFQNASKEDLKISGKDKVKEKEIKENFKDLTKWWKDLLGIKLAENVKVSSRLSDTPCVVVTSKYGWSANMERIMQAQALTDSSKQSYMKGRKTLEINPHHPLIKKLQSLVAEDSKNPKAAEIAKVLYETALLESGFILEEPTDFAKRVYASVAQNLDVDPEAAVEEDEDVNLEEDKDEKKEEEKPDVYYDENNEEIYPVEVVDEEKGEGAAVPEAAAEVEAPAAPEPEVVETGKDEL